MTKKPLLLLSLVLFSFSLLGQKQNQVEWVGGAEFRTLIPVSFFTMDPVTLVEDSLNFTSTYTYEGGMGFGGVVRVNFNKFINLESGIYFTRRVYKYDILDPSVGYEAETELRTVGYELPVKALFYVQMAEKVYVNVALGLSADFYASDVETLNPFYSVRAFKQHWIQLGVLGSLGAEYRTEKDGYFYLGATFHQAFGDIYSTQVNYYRDTDPPAYFQNGFIEGAYFSVDFRYFFPNKNAKKGKVRHVKPDWKNM